MTGRLRRRLRAWFESRLPRSDTWTLTQRNIYIVPTRAGLMFAMVLLVMLVASINYQLSLGYVLTFLLAGAGFVSMHLTHNTLRGVTLHLRPPPSGFAGQPMVLEVQLSSPSRTQHGLGLGFEDAPDRSQDVFVDVPAGAMAVARLSFVPPHRGRHGLPTLHVETRYPLGLFRAWTVWRPASQALAWPTPEVPVAPWPASPSSAGAAAAHQAAAGGEFDGVRSYRRGDPLRGIVWKKVAKGGDLVSRESSSALQRELWLDWQQAQLAGVEPRLSRLAAWVVAADAAGLPHGLRLPGVEIAPAQGAAHRRASLDALGAWQG